MAMSLPFNHEDKKRIILKGMQGVSINDICEEYGITESQYIEWRDTVFAYTVVEGPKTTHSFTYNY